MVDFRKRLGSRAAPQPIDPIETYEGLDRASDKGELRRVQEAVLREWHSNRREKRDVIVKLHTGQGKTLIGLLILQSKLNEGVGPALYLCPDNFLVEQTALQARQFGLACETIAGGDELPTKFIDSKAILITSVQTMFMPASVQFVARARSDSHGKARRTQRSSVFLVMRSRVRARGPTPIS